MSGASLHEWPAGGGRRSSASVAEIAGAEGLDLLDVVPVGEAKQRMVAAFRGDVAAAAEAWATAGLRVSSGVVSARDLDHAIDFAGFTQSPVSPEVRA